jgi:hypothetical protein
MNIGRRIQLEGPDWRAPLAGVPWWKCSGGHGSDEYGNCSVYFRCFLFGIVFFWDPHYQDKVELPLNLNLPQEEERDQWRWWYSEKFEGGEDLWS